jgi:hypothetical protein
VTEREILIDYIKKNQRVPYCPYSDPELVPNQSRYCDKEPMALSIKWNTKVWICVDCENFWSLDHPAIIWKYK